MTSQSEEKEIKGRHGVVLFALMENCKRSDREIAKKAKVSQPTVTRIRQRLEKLGIVKRYLAIPDYAKLGYEFGAVTLCASTYGEPIDISKYSSLLAAEAISKNGDYLLITLHRSIDDYRSFLNEVNTSESFLFSTKGLEISPIKAPEKAA
jgi:DNA-binding Lrp family transcriptional regulator